MGFWVSNLAILISICLVKNSVAIGTMSIDLGNEFIKVAIVKSGIPMEIALDKESQRKTPSVVSIRNDERSFGSEALNVATKFPHMAYQYIPSIIGKSLSHPDVQLFMKRFPYYKLSYEDVSGQLMFEHDKNLKFSAEELLAMLLENARDMAQSHADEIMKAAVITVPSYYGQAERRAVKRAAELIGLDVHQLMNEDTAVALHFGVFRRKFFNSTAQYYIFYNMGSQSTSAILVSYQVVKSKEGAIAEDVPELTVLGVGHDTSLGITEFAIRLRDHMAKAFNKQHKNLDAFKDNRAMSKLFKEAKRVVKILSANTDIYAQVEYLMDEKDFKLKISRSDLEEMCKDLYGRLSGPITQALEAAQLAMPIVKELILMGGGTRMPRVQEKLLEISGKAELGRSINTDEAAALGAVYQAAYHSPGFKVLKFNVKDYCPYPISANFKAMKDADREDRTVLVYKRSNPYPQRRALSLNKQQSDMDIYINYDGDSLLETDREHLSGLWNISRIELVDVEETVKTHLEGGAKMKGFKVHFDMDYSGILNVLDVEARLEYNAAPVKEPSTLESLGTKISGFFGKEAEEDISSSSTKSDEKNDTKSANSTTGNSTGSIGSEGDSQMLNDTKPFIKVALIKYKLVYLDAPIPDIELMKEISKRLKLMRENEQNLIALEKSRNELESFIFSARDRMQKKDYIEHSTEDVRSHISTALDAASSWYEEQGMDTTKSDYEKRLADLKTLVSPVEVRMRETQQLPKAFQTLETSIDLANQMLLVMHEFVNISSFEEIFKGNLTADFPMLPIEEHRDSMNMLVQEHAAKAFVESELTAFRELIESTRKWHNDSKGVSETTAKHEDFAVTTSHVGEKNGEIIRKVSFYKEKFDNQRRTIQFELRKWMRVKEGELKDAIKAAKQNVVEEKDQKNANVVDEQPETSSSSFASSSDDSSTPRSDL